MANFNTYIDPLLDREGVYSNDAADRGKETVYGITRINWEKKYPKIFAIVDSVKSTTSDLKNALKNHPTLMPLVKDFYKKEFWDKVGGDDFPDKLANELFDSAVNLGVKRTLLWLQRITNALNRQEKDWKDIDPDGEFGDDTLKATKACFALRGEQVLLKCLNCLQGAYYIELAEKDKTQEKFLNGWINARVEI